MIISSCRGQSLTVHITQGLCTPKFSITAKYCLILNTLGPVLLTVGSYAVVL